MLTDEHTDEQMDASKNSEISNDIRKNCRKVDLSLEKHLLAPQWARIIRNPDWSTGPLTRPFAHSLTPLTCSLDPDCSLRSCPRSLARGKEVFCMKWTRQSHTDLTHCVVRHSAAATYFKDTFIFHPIFWLTSSLRRGIWSESRTRSGANGCPYSDAF